MTTELRVRASSLWVLAAPPAIWATHFLLSYITAAIICEKSAAPIAASAAQVAIAVYTVAALVASVLIARWGWRHHARGGSALPHDDDTPEDRERFLGFATFLLSGLVTVAVIYLALSVTLAGTCR